MQMRPMSDTLRIKLGTGLGSRFRQRTKNDRERRRALQMGGEARTTRWENSFCVVAKGLQDLKRSKLAGTPNGKL